VLLQCWHWLLSRLRMYARTSGGILMRGDFFWVMAID
jgi:hypothetical protein